jgi:HD-GYP domain-containing protein (c-di-GMP phosphodiesterase class II)
MKGAWRTLASAMECDGRTASSRERRIVSGSSGPRAASETQRVLKRISVRDVKLGMYVHAIEGPWLAHNYWRWHFLLTSAEQVATLRHSGVPGVVIDLGRSITLAARKRPPGTSRKDTDRNRNEQQAKDMRAAKRVTDDARRFMKKVFDDLGAGETTALGELEAVVQSIEAALVHNRSTLLSVMRLKTRDTYTYFHSVAVGTLMINFARELGLPEDQVRLMGLGGLIHDIGKTQIAKAILEKPGKLTDAEFDEVRQHPARGHAMLIGGDVASVALDVCLHHHEKVDGSGYPFGLAGDDISLAARMGAICDIYDALTSDRPYKDAWSPVAAVAAMVSWQGHLDQKLMFVFMKSIGVFPAGMLIQLRTGHLAIVRDNGRNTGRARLAIFYDTENQRFLSPYELYLSDINPSELMAEAPDPAALGLGNWPELKQQLLAGVDPTVGTVAQARDASNCGA